MEKQELINKYNEEDRLSVAKILDKIKLCKTRNKIVNTDFLDMYKQKVAINILQDQKVKNYILYKTCNEADKAILIIYPEKYEEIFKTKCFDYNSIVSVIRITLPNMLKEKYVHKDYLSGIMKLGIVREKIGDIFVFEDGADILVIKDVSKYILENLSNLTRFSKSIVEEKNLSQLRKPEIKKEEKRITVAALRLDCIVSEMANISRNTANEAIISQRVYINYEIAIKPSKAVKEGDVIVVRGKGKFVLKEIQGQTRKGKIAVLMEHYI